MEEELYVAEKRKLLDVSNVTFEPYASDKSKRRNISKVTRSGMQYNKPVIINKDAKPHGSNNSIQDVVMTTVNIDKEKDETQTKDNNKKLSKSPKHPQLPVKYSEAHPEKTKKIDSIVESIINKPTHRISLNQLAELSPVARSKIKGKITKPHTNVVNVPEHTVLLGENNKGLPKGKGAPRTYGIVNGETCEIILDGGCTSFIISLDFARKIGLKKLEFADTPVMFGDGNFYKPIGLAKNLRIKIGGSKTVSVNALCFDVNKQYDVIVGREVLHALRIGTNWETHFWYINSDNGVIPFDVQNSKDIKRREIDSDESEEEINDEDYMDNEDSEEGFLIMEASDSEDEDIADNNDPEYRLGELIKRIQSQDNIEENEKILLTNLTEKYKHCFGTDYNHLGQTNLVKFHVDTGNAKPIYRRPYGFLSMSEKLLMQKDL